MYDADAEFNGRSRRSKSFRVLGLVKRPETIVFEDYRQEQESVRSTSPVRHSTFADRTKRSRLCWTGFLGATIAAGKLRCHRERLSGHLDKHGDATTAATSRKSFSGKPCGKHTDGFAQPCSSETLFIISSYSRCLWSLRTGDFLSYIALVYTRILEPGQCCLLAHGDRFGSSGMLWPRFPCIGFSTPSGCTTYAP